MAARPPERIEVDGLVLRRHQPSDVAALVIAVNESADHLRPWMPWAGQPATVDSMSTFVKSAIADFDSGRNWGYLLVAPTPETVVGSSGLHGRRRAGTLEIGYWVHRQWTRRGIASTAAAALTDVAFTIDGIERVEIHCDETNIASAGVPRRLGFELEAIVPKAPEAPGETGREMVWVATRPRTPKK